MTTYSPKLKIFKSGQTGTLLTIGLAWVLINALLLWKNGIISNGEASKYIHEAHVFIQTGHMESNNFWFYFVQIALLSFCIKLHVGFSAIVVIQLACNLIATVYLYKTLINIFSGYLTATIGTLLLLFNYPYQEFNTFLQTESLFYSFTLVLSCYVLNLEKITYKNLIHISLLLLLILFTRPTGMLFIPPSLLYVYFLYFKQMSVPKKLGLLSVILILFFAIVDKALSSGGALDFMLPFRDERIICGVPTLQKFLAIDTSANPNSLFGMAYYIVHNFSQFIRLTWLKTVAFFGLYRNYYSFFHNAYLILYFYLLYVLAALSASNWLKKNYYRLLFLSGIIALNWMTVILTCDDWHNRFYLSVSPYIIILSMPFFKKMAKKNERL